MGKCRHFCLRPHAPNAPIATFDVVASVQGDCLQLSYFIDNKLKDKFNVVSDTVLTQADFLWEKTCLECFFDVGQADYFELNFCPIGAYNLYHFDEYRTPNTLPPKRADGMVFLVQCNNKLPYLSYHLGVKLDNIHTLTPNKINPTAIVYDSSTPYFYATKHKNPPDFHNKSVWADWQH